MRATVFLLVLPVGLVGSVALGGPTPMNFTEVPWFKWTIGSDDYGLASNSEVFSPPASCFKDDLVQNLGTEEYSLIASGAGPTLDRISIIGESAFAYTTVVGHANLLLSMPTRFVVAGGQLTPGTDASSFSETWEITPDFGSFESVFFGPGGFESSPVFEPGDYHLDIWIFNDANSPMGSWVDNYIEFGQVIPLPTPALMATTGLGLVMLRRRR